MNLKPSFIQDGPLELNVEKTLVTHLVEGDCFDIGLMFNSVAKSVNFMELE